MKENVDKYILIREDALGQQYICKICWFAPNRVNIHVKGWGKRQFLMKRLREHIRQEHGNDTQ